MKDVVSLMASKGTLGFTIQSSILEKIGLNLGDTVEIEIFKDFKSNPSFVITRPLRTIGSSKGITLRKHVSEELGLKVGDALQVDIRKP